MADAFSCSLVKAMNIHDSDLPLALKRRIRDFKDELRLWPNDHPYDISRTLPVTVFHPILAEFKYDIANLSTFDPTSREIEWTLEFIMKSLEIYPVEGDRIEETTPVLQKLIGSRNPILMGGNPTTGKVFHDRDLAVVATVEWRTGDASVEVAEAYRKHVFQGSVCMRLAYSHRRRLTCHSYRKFVIRAAVPLFSSPSWVPTCESKAPSYWTKSSTKPSPSTSG
jgi:hypothetical protein